MNQVHRSIAMIVTVSQGCTLEHNTAAAPDLVHAWVTCQRVPDSTPGLLDQNLWVETWKFSFTRSSRWFICTGPSAPCSLTPTRGVSKAKMGGPRAWWEFSRAKSIGKGAVAGYRTWGEKGSWRESPSSNHKELVCHRPWAQSGSPAYGWMPLENLLKFLWA